MSNSKCTTAPLDTRDWSLCFICQQEKSNENVLDHSSSIKLRNNPEKLYVCYKEITNNIRELKELGELHDFVTVNDVMGCGNSGGGGIDDGSNGGGTEDVVEVMISNPVFWHKSCRNVIDNQKLERARERSREPLSQVKTQRRSSYAKSPTGVSPKP